MSPRRCGELLKQVEAQPGKRTDLQPDTAADTRSGAATAAGLSKRQKDTALRVASVPLEDFERHLPGAVNGATERTDPDALLFATRAGTPLNPSNVRRDIWRPVVKRAGVRELVMYSLRHTFASCGRAAGEEAFNVLRAMGHARSELVDQVYAHALLSGMASVAERVTARALGVQPKLRVIEGGQRDVRQTLDEQSAEGTEARASA